MDEPICGLRAWVKRYALSVGFWLTVAPLAAAQGMRTAHLVGVTARFDYFLLVYAARYLSVAVLTPLVFRAVERWPVTQGRLTRLLPYTLAFVPFTLAFAAIRWLLLPPWLDEIHDWGARNLLNLIHLATDTFADVALLYLGVLTAAHAYTYARHAQREEFRRLELERGLAQSELQSLRAQLHPHFLFNTLQGISTLVSRDAEAAREMIARLASLLRTVLRHSSGDVVALRTELAFARDYLALEQKRLADRLQISWRIAPSTQDYMVPQLLLQPLLENALLHGIAPNQAGGWLAVSTDVADGQLRILIRNSVAAPSTK
ncbi:MAG: histidine kinase, partial [Sinobacteraceae bacterium]|nr:histidine kinase [Nevskiaceae bacterium]